MNIEFTQKLRDLATKTKFREVKNKIDAYFTLYDEIDIADEKQAQFLMEQLTPFKAKDQGVYTFCVAFENRKALNEMGMTDALMKIKQSKLYGVNTQIKERIDQLLAMKAAGGRQSKDIKIFEAYQNEVQGLVLDDFFDKYMSDVKAKYNQYLAYECVDEALETLSKDPNPELLDNVFQKLESSMSLPASQVPFFLIKNLSGERHLSPAIDKLLLQLKAIDPMTQRTTMNQIRYVGNAGVYESVLAPVAFGKDSDLVMLGNRLFKVSETEICEAGEEDGIEASFIALCEAFAQTKISEAGSLSIVDRNDNLVEIDENAEGGLQLTINKNQIVAVTEDKGWQQELLAAQIEPKAVTLVGLIMENRENIVNMDNIMSVTSAGGAGYSMFFIKQGSGNHIIINDPTTNGIAIQKNVSVKEAVDTAKEAFGANISKFFEEKKENDEMNEDAKDDDDEMKNIDAEIKDCDEALAEIYKYPKDVQESPDLMEQKKAIEERKNDLSAKAETLAGKMAVATE